MDQLNLLQTSEEKAYESIKPSLVEVLEDNGLDESYLTFEVRKNYHSVLFKGSSVIVRFASKPSASLSVSTPTLSASKGFSSMADERGAAYTKIPLATWEDIQKHTFMLQEILQLIIDRIPKEFDCCSRYKECSDAMRCIHPDKDFALLCGYRKILRSGRIFYGKNRNIDYTKEPPRAGRLLSNHAIEQMYYAEGGAAHESPSSEETAVGQLVHPAAPGRREHPRHCRNC